jgi:hypothetical protein
MLRLLGLVGNAYSMMDIAAVLSIAANVNSNDGISMEVNSSLVAHAFFLSFHAKKEYSLSHTDNFWVQRR